MARGELYIQLVVNYGDDEKLADVSRSARLLYVDALCKAKATANDGVLTPGQVERLGYPDKPSTTKKAAGELVATGAWLWDEGRKVYTITGWLKRNKSRAQIAEDRRLAEEAAALGNHKRWHKGRGESDPKCPHCAAEASPPGSGNRSAPRSPSGSGPRNRTESPETETETETEKRSSGGAVGAPLTPGANEAAPAPQCPDHEGMAEPPSCGRCADARRARTRWDIADAERRRTQAQCRHHRGHPADRCGLCRSEALAQEDA